MVYDDCYNITFFGIEKLHPFDSTKFRKASSLIGQRSRPPWVPSVAPHTRPPPPPLLPQVVGLLERAGVLRRSQLVPPKEASEAALLEVHDAEYLRQLDTSPLKVAYVSAPRAGLLLSTHPPACLPGRLSCHLPSGSATQPAHLPACLPACLPGQLPCPVALPCHCCFQIPCPASRLACAHSRSEEAPLMWCRLPSCRRWPSCRPSCCGARCCAP